MGLIHIRTVWRPDHYMEPLLEIKPVVKIVKAAKPAPAPTRLPTYESEIP